MRVSIDPVVMAAQPPGSMSGFIDIFSSTAPQTPRRLFVSVQYYNGVPRSQEPFVFGAVPFGVMDTPTEGATGLSGAVPVTGWAVDAFGITAIQIYRDPVAGEPRGSSSLATPPACAARGPTSCCLPRVPDTAGGWGYMLLSNVLPGGGNGTFHALAYVDDLEGHRTLLGTKR